MLHIFWNANLFLVTKQNCSHTVLQISIDRQKSIRGLYQLENLSCYLHPSFYKEYTISRILSQMKEQLA